MAVYPRLYFFFSISPVMSFLSLWDQTTVANRCHRILLEFNYDESSLNFRMIYCRSQGTSTKNYRMFENTSIPVSPKFPVFCYLILA